MQFTVCCFVLGPTSSWRMPLCFLCILSKWDGVAVLIPRAKILLRNYCFQPSGMCQNDSLVPGIDKTGRRYWTEVAATLEGWCWVCLLAIHIWGHSCEDYPPDCGASFVMNAGIVAPILGDPWGWTTSIPSLSRSLLMAWHWIWILARQSWLTVCVQDGHRAGFDNRRNDLESHWLLLTAC